MPLVPVPDLAGARRLLCVQPHYDDNDLGAGGTLATLAASGAALVYVTVADDLLGVLDPDLPDAEALRRLRAEQAEAGRIVGVAEQVRLDLPDAGEWDHGALRAALVREIRRVRPDFVVTVDPWLALEAHRDHVRTGLAAAEAVLLAGLPRVRTEPALDASYLASRERVRGVVFTFTGRPNLFFDVGPGRAAKHRAIDAYVSQLAPGALRVIHAGLEAKERAWGARAGCAFAEALRVVHPAHLHCNPDAEEMEAG
jgi:LmbE family N-acetylglucosaminyl deacetylase